VKNLTNMNSFQLNFDLSPINWLHQKEEINVHLTPIIFLGIFVAMQYALFPAKYL